ALVLVGACCISETIASAYLQHCGKLAQGRARETIKTLLRDEIGHAQLGWGYVATLAPASPGPHMLRASISGLIARTEETWLGLVAELHRVPAPDHGFPSTEA